MLRAMIKPTEEDFAWFDRLLPEHPGVTRKPMFGNVAGFANGNMFLCLLGPTVAVRLDEAGRAELLTHDGADLFDPMGGRPMKEYVTLPPAWRDDDDRAATWVQRSLDFTLTLPPKQPKKKVKA
jgi:TfoX/Sxy family transcriptional regulator of competence genes